MSKKRLMAAVVCDAAAADFPAQTVDMAVYLEQNQADGMLLMDQRAASDAQEEMLIALIKKAAGVSDLPLSVMQQYRRFEDAKKTIYAGAAQVVVPVGTKMQAAVAFEAAARFTGQVAAYIDVLQNADEQTLGSLKENGIDEVYMPYSVFLQCREILEKSGLLAVVTDRFCKTAKVSAEESRKPQEMSVLEEVLAGVQVAGVADISLTEKKDRDISLLKAGLKQQGIDVNVFESSLAFSEFKLNSDGLIPVIVQDYKSGKVLMLAYMNAESYEETLRSGRMTYFSRSRQELWKKGETSGHYQYVKSIEIDCDRDTMLAKVAQVGAACHTGNESCFYTNLVKKEYDDVNPLTIFDEIMNTILERKAHPKEGSYTNYLFDKGVDKILKKVGEEATEIVIAAKNPGAEELKYEICDFLYHMMVLMADRGVTWKEITKELATRH